MTEQGGQGGSQRYTDEDVETLLNETAKRAAAEVLKSVTTESREEDDEFIGVSPKLVKQLQGTVTVFNTLKEFASNPIQKAIETRVGELAAGVIENAFGRPNAPAKKDIIDTILNSQFAYGLGSGIGQRAPELVESMGKTFGRDKAEQMIDGIIGRYGKGQPPVGRQLSPSAPASEQKQQTEKELLLSLDPNNPEHVAAYAESQGGISVDTARKMLMIHQDEFIKQMKDQGADVSQITMARGSHSEKPVSEIQPKHKPEIQTSIPTQPPTQEQYSPGIEYTDFQDVQQPPPAPPPGHSGNPSMQDNQQVELMKQFADDIGKVMGDIVNRIESLNNTVFVLQNEMNEMKRQAPKAPQVEAPRVETPRTPKTPHRIETPPTPIYAVYPPMQTPTAVQSITPIHTTHTPEISYQPKTSPEEETQIKSPEEETQIKSPEEETQIKSPEEETQIKSPEEETQIKTSEEFFGDKIQDAGDFFRELEREAKEGAQVKEKEEDNIKTSQITSTQEYKEETRIDKESKKFVNPIKKIDMNYAPSFKPNN